MTSAIPSLATVSLMRIGLSAYTSLVAIRSDFGEVLGNVVPRGSAGPWQRPSGSPASPCGGSPRCCAAAPRSASSAMRNPRGAMRKTSRELRATNQ